jgi:hypothetical protein
MALKTNNGYLVAPADYSTYTYAPIYEVLIQNTTLSLCCEHTRIEQIKKILYRVKHNCFPNTKHLGLAAKLEPHIGEQGEPNDNTLYP